MPRLRPSPRSLLPAVLAVALDAGTVRAQNPAVTIAVDAAAQQHAISDGVYGIAYGDAATLADLNSPLNRLGGNNTSRYNWQINADNRGADWYFESVPDGSSVAGEVGDSFVSMSKGAYYSLANTSTSAVSGTLVLLDPAGAVLNSSLITVPPAQSASANTQALGVARGQTGTARFTHDGPPGAIIAEAAIARFSTSPAYVQPVKFQPVRQAR